MHLPCSYDRLLMTLVVVRWSSGASLHLYVQVKRSTIFGPAVRTPGKPAMLLMLPPRSSAAIVRAEGSATSTCSRTRCSAVRSASSIEELPRLRVVSARHERIEFRMDGWNIWRMELTWTWQAVLVLLGKAENWSPRFPEIERNRQKCRARPSLPSFLQGVVS